MKGSKMRNKALWGAILSAALIVGTAGCGDDDGSAGGSGGSGGTAGTGGTAGSGGTAGDGGAAGAGAVGGEGGAGGSPAEIHGCTPDAAMDMTGMAAVNITDIDAWQVPHNACIRISVGTEVTWEGNFSVHPLVGGVTPNEDAASPITEAEANVGLGSATVTFDDVGSYPYFCEVHINSMFGVVYVVP